MTLDTFIETFWGLLTHFVYDITHFDSKFFSTLKYLFAKPGFLSLEFLKGRRASYLHPIRMYVFTSALFFVIFFTLYSASSLIKEEQDLDQQRSNISLALLLSNRALCASCSADIYNGYQITTSKKM